MEEEVKAQEEILEEVQPEGVKVIEIDQLKGKVEELEQEKKELWDRLLRVQAEFENHKKRIAKEMEAFRESAHETVICDILYVLDNIERALDAGEKGANREGLLEGLKLIHKQFKETLKRYGVEEIRALGCKFNPNLHQAVMQINGEREKDEVVVQEIEKGYLLKGNLLRPSKVVVCKYKSAKEEGKQKNSGQN